MNSIQIETASLKAWPAFEQADDNGWISRFADGYTKRSNSVTVLLPGADSPENRIQQYERLYNTKGQPCIFRLISFNDNTEIEKILDSKIYTDGDHSLVLSQELKDRNFKPVAFDSIMVDDWMKYYCELSGKEIKAHSIHTKMIKGIRGKYLLAALSLDKNIVSCGLGIITDGILGIFDIVTHPQHRKKGFGSELINGMLQWGIQNDAHAVYLQVVAENTPAVRLYKKMGFELSYEYIYKIQNFFEDNHMVKQL